MTEYYTKPWFNQNFRACLQQAGGTGMCRPKYNNLAMT